MRSESSRRLSALRRGAATTVIAAALAIWPVALWAQQTTAPMPDASAGAAPAPLDNSAAAQSQPLDPMSAVDDPGDAATVSIPGGGEVQAQGPSGTAPGSQIPPNETWGASRIDPNGSGTTPIGP
jgi:hypothetical protein